jgi:ectoine hydroxylase-related dioxygenase (phytanoyl-CoA dioxygenase family)
MSKPQALTMPDALVVRFETLGVAVIEYALSDEDVVAMDALFPRLPDRAAGARAADFSPEGRAFLARHDSLSALACRLAGLARMQLSRIQAFDKSAGSNWFVPWHQDRAEDGYERPVADLERTVALRIHLDACDEHNGPLDVIPGSHTHGRLDSQAISRLVQSHTPLLCLAARGDIVAIRPLLVHRSQKARAPAARRVLHLEYAPVRPLTT